MQKIIYYEIFNHPRVRRVVMETHYLQIGLNLASAPFGFAAMYYGYLGYMKTKGGLKAFLFYLLAMTALGATMLFDLLRLMGFTSIESLIELGTFLVALFFFLAFKNIHDFLSKTF
jgi:hypothetical protein